MSMRRASWTWPARHTFVTKEGYELNMTEACPMDVAAMLRKDVQSKLWEDWTKAEEYQSLSPAPLLRLQAQADWQTVAEQQDTNMLWTRGRVRTPEADWTFVGIGEDQYYGQVVQGDEDYFAGDIVCDGSKLGYSDWAQTGWAAMSLTDEGSAKMQLWGPLPCPLPIHRRVKRAEMWASLKVLERMMPPGRIYTGHKAIKGILGGSQKGEWWYTSWKRPHADIWKRIWHKVKDLDLDVGCVSPREWDNV
ncbi:unnamed protein product [Prorocentrum cordatum]|uniref:Uncharacterized protein n=1 Tax=Prorocentrum cordatum TaxID=2364126 RepID=A0ABN9S232_9DINO|nr:unnamed protein product [Polarella glacialis]